MKEGSKTAVQGLRNSDPMTLSVLIQDLLRVPLAQLEAQTLCDLIALGEAEGLSRITNHELLRFRRQMDREYRDLPDGPLFHELLDELSALDAGQVPGPWREIVLTRSGEVSARSQRGLDALAQSWADTAPTPVTIAARQTTRVQRPEVPNSHRAPEERRRTRTRTRAPSSRSATPARVRDPQRAEWIREDVIDRLRNYGSRGLKQSIVVAGAQHRSPWSDLAEDEVMSVLRKLKNEGVVKFSAGRWMLGRAW